MNLRDFVVSRHWAMSPDDRKCLCPFHGDRNPSAYLNDNYIYCFVEGKTYSLYDFNKVFGVHLTRVEDSHSLGLIQGKEISRPNPVLFTYNWEEERNNG